jgi:hypothetical protein
LVWVQGSGFRVRNIKQNARLGGRAVVVGFATTYDGGHPARVMVVVVVVVCCTGILVTI